jgi:hypothetical protein
VAALRADSPKLTAGLTDVFLSYFLFARKMDGPAPLRCCKITWNGACFTTLIIWIWMVRVRCRISAIFLLTRLVAAINKVLESGVFHFLPPHVRGPKGEGDAA